MINVLLSISVPCKSEKKGVYQTYITQMLGDPPVETVGLRLKRFIAN